MCVIIYKPAGETVSEKSLRECWKANPDGGGYMFATGGEVRIVKGLMAYETFLFRYVADSGRYPGSDFVLHFRIATSGGVDKANCHPFTCGHGAGLTHNGILDTVEVPRDSKESDTAIFCRDIVAKLPADWTTSDAHRHLMEGYAKANRSKFVVLTPDGAVSLFNEKAGEWSGKIWYSVPSLAPFDAVEWRDSVECSICGEFVPWERTTDTELGCLCKECCEYMERYDVCDVCGHRGTIFDGVCNCCADGVSTLNWEEVV